jgi:hypothetical protein
VLISCIYWWPCYLRGFSYVCEASYPAQQKTFSWCTVFVSATCWPLFWIWLVFEFFLTNLGTPPYLLLIAKPLRLLDVFRLLTICAKTSISLGNPLLL